MRHAQIARLAYIKHYVENIGLITCAASNIVSVSRTYERFISRLLEAIEGKGV